MHRLFDAGRDGGTSVNVGCSDENAPAKFAIAEAVVNQTAGETNARMPVANSLRGVRNRYIELVIRHLTGAHSMMHAPGRKLWAGPTRRPKRRLSDDG